MKLALIVLLPFLLLASGLDAQLKVTLLEGHEVRLYSQRNLRGAAPAFAYEPFGLRLAEREGEKQFSFLAYRPDSTAAISGGILHFLLTWGPDADQEKELMSLLRMRTDSSHQLTGCLMLETDPSVAELEIGPADHPLAQLLQRSLNAAAAPPLRPGGKMAASFSLSAEDARTFSATLAHPEDWQEVFLRIRLRTFGRAYEPAPPSTFTLTKSFASCLESL